MNDSKKGFVHNVRQSVLTTLVLLLICGFLFPVVLTGLSAVMFPHQAGGSLLTTADGTAVGAQNVGQDFTQPYFMKGRPSAYQYNTYYEDEEGNQFYNDGTEFAGLSSGSNNYGPSNPALAERVQADIEEFLAANPGVKREDIPTDLLTASGSGLFWRGLGAWPRSAPFSLSGPGWNIMRAGAATPRWNSMPSREGPKAAHRAVPPAGRRRARRRWILMLCGR